MFTAMADNRPLIALTIGDPAGVGPEIAARALAESSTHELMRPLLVGDAEVMGQVVSGAELDLDVRPIAAADELSGEPGVVEVLDLDNVDDVTFGAVDPQCGRAAVAYIERACELARDGDVDGIVTGPISKEAIKAGGSTFPGHTEMLADLLGVPEDDVVTMFALEQMRIFFLTRHHPLTAAIAQVTTERVHSGLVRVNELLGELGVDSPRIALAALNPHAGENGILGSEEGDILEPAVELARADGVDVTGPVPADSVFWQARQGHYDGVISLYHDQGHVAAKTVSFFGVVSVTLGLPVVRTAAEHGTAFDIAGRWIADPGGQLEAMRVAAELAPEVRRVRAGASG